MPAPRICFEYFRVATLLNDRVNEVCKQVNCERIEAGEYAPKATKYVWTQNPDNMPHERRGMFKFLRDPTLKAVKECAKKYAIDGYCATSPVAGQPRSGSDGLPARCAVGSSR
jgi:hypothetical protein